jgi:degradative hydroxymethylglutaryl-CoA reductase
MQQKDIILSNANSFCPGMLKRGGGVVDFKIHKLSKSNPKNDISFHLICHFHIDVCDSMGANCATSVAEGIAPMLQILSNGRIGLRIVSNLAPERISNAKFRIPIDKLAYKGRSGREVAEKIVEAYEWALDDPFRAVTHNKGIMNGIDAVALATGQDWRAIEASSHAWASINSPNGHYRPLSRYWIDNMPTIGDVFCGELILPIPCGTRGGVLKTHPNYHVCLEVMGL